MSLMAKTLHVGIVGAGVSGLRCAAVLIQNGIQVTILEARNRVGGRVLQSEIGGHLVDLGPNFIHGTVDNPLCDLAAQSNATTIEWEEQASIYHALGNRYDDKIATKLTEFMWDTINKAFKYSREHTDTIPADRSLWDFFQEEVQKKDLTLAEKDACMEISKTWSPFVGDSIHRQSLKFFYLEECINGNNLFVASTFKGILEKLSGPVIEKADIRFNETVTHIKAQPRKPGAEHQVIVTTEARKQYTFDELVVTCPLGWLKRNKAVFAPSLPSTLSNAIDNISYGRLEKVYVTFRRAFWNTNATSSVPIVNIIGEDDNDKFPSRTTTLDFVQFMDPAYVNHPADAPWNQECVSLATLPAPYAHPTLLFYVYGQCGTHIITQLKNLDPSSDQYYKILNEFLSPFYSRLPNYSAWSADCIPSAFLATQWQNDPLAGNGSYSNFQIGLEQGEKDIETFREGTGASRGVWFAGEHAAPFADLGTATGAYWSGERAAGQICNLHGLPKV